MTVQTDHRPDTDSSRQHSNVRRPSRIWWLLALLAAMAAAAVVGVAVAAQLTSPTTHTQTVYLEPNANTREDRVTAPTDVEPKANTREGRLPTPTDVEPNANTREGRVSGNG
jgi:hypothetical protein